VPPGLDGEALEPWRERVERGLTAINARTDQLAGASA